MIRTEDNVGMLLPVPRGRWIALSEDESRVVGVGSTMQEAVISAAQNGVSEPVLIRMPWNWKFEDSKYVN